MMRGAAGTHKGDGVAIHGHADVLSDARSCFLSNFETTVQQSNTIICELWSYTHQQEWCQLSSLSPERVNFPSVRERRHKRSTRLHRYGESTAVQERFHLRARAKTKNTRKDEKDKER